jgi:hypothetical protein
MYEKLFMELFRPPKCLLIQARNNANKRDRCGQHKNYERTFSYSSGQQQACCCAATRHTAFISRCKARTPPTPPKLFSRRRKNGT